MNRIILIFAFFGSAVLCEEVARKPKLFFVSTSTTTSTLQTASMSCDLTYHYHLHREEEENHLLGRNGTRRSSSAVHLQEGSCLLYWITTTSISTSTSFTITYSVSSVLCTP